MMFKELKQDHDAKKIWIIWYKSKPWVDDTSHYGWDWSVYFDENDFHQDLDWIKENYEKYKVVVYSQDDAFTNKFSFT